jgi:hypothetical protein
MRLETLTVALFYEHRDAGTWSLLDLSRHRGIIDPSDLEPGSFLKASGAIRMYSDRFKCFLRTGAAGDLRSYVNFLVESLVSDVESNVSIKFPGISPGVSFFDYQSVVSGLFQENQTTILLQDRGNEFEISYLDSNGDAPEFRLSPYFREVRIVKSVWRAAAVEALDEYCSVAEERLLFGKNAELQDLVTAWRSSRDALI